VGWLRDTDVASHALKVGDAAPDFLLPDADGRLHSSEQLRRSGPLVLSFFRGGWCPFCTADFTIQEEPAQILAPLRRVASMS
jgi:peroxiredoxin